MSKLVRGVISFIMAIIAYGIIYVAFHIFPFELERTMFNIVWFGIPVIVGIIFYIFFSSSITNKFFDGMSKTVENLSKMNAKELIAGVIGVVIGLGIANLLGLAFHGLGLVGTVIVILLNIIFGYVGYKVATAKKDDMNFNFIKERSKKSSVPAVRSKILDTSVIIDGRIKDILETGFIEGKIIVPNFVLDELRHIADSADSLKRTRGRHGLDILKDIRNNPHNTVEVVDFNTDEDLEVDVKLLKMGEKLDAFVVTNDFNLNKVAEVHGVRILNINDLSNAIKPIVLPGEEMKITIVKSGKEAGQGVAYLNDGTMIVAEGGEKHIGEEMNVIVTSVLQTSAGRMIFTKLHAYD